MKSRMRVFGDSCKSECVEPQGVGYYLDGSHVLNLDCLLAVAAMTQRFVEGASAPHGDLHSHLRSPLDGASAPVAATAGRSARLRALVCVAVRALFSWTDKTPWRITGPAGTAAAHSRL